MLTFKRCEDEKIIIVVPPSTSATKIQVQLDRITGHNSARIGTEAPRNVQVDREEISNRKKWDADTFGVSSSRHHEAELDDVPAIIAEAKRECLAASDDPDLAHIRLADQMIRRLATLLSQERRKQ